MEYVIRLISKVKIMKKLLLTVLAIMMVGCAGKLGNKTDRLINDGHDYQWIVFYDRSFLVHSPDCDTCKTIRHAEIESYVDSIMGTKKGGKK